MALLVKLKQLEQDDVQLKGELPIAELELDDIDELIHAEQPLRYDVEVQKMEKSLLAHGRISLELRCDCARCLKSFVQKLEFKDWACHLALEGDDKALVVNDSVDLTPYVR